MFNVNTTNYFYPINIPDDVEIIKHDLQTIDIALRSNHKLLLIDTEQFKVQLDITGQDLLECNQKLDFLLKGVNGKYSQKLLELREKSNEISRQLQIYTHIYTLKTKGK